MGMDNGMKKTSLNSRQRVLRTINHQEPDRVPFNLALTVDVYHRLRAYLGLPPEPERRSESGPTSPHRWICWMRWGWISIRSA